MKYSVLDKSVLKLKIIQLQEHGCNIIFNVQILTDEAYC